jgi:anhydro-N-acetylmuramic acid kinase
LLSSLLTEPFFTLPPPKSTGRDVFHADWLRHHLLPFSDLAAADVQASLAQLTARSASSAIKTYAATAEQVWVCGGGAYNLHLMKQLQWFLPQMKVAPTDEIGLPPLQVEAAAFAWLARQTVLGLPGNLPAVTGAKGLRVLGGLYPA